MVVTTWPSSTPTLLSTSGRSRATRASSPRTSTLLLRRSSRARLDRSLVRGSSTTDTDVYGTIFLGRQALAKVWAMKDGNGPHPVLVMGPITDTLRRFQPLGWKWLGG